MRTITLLSMTLLITEAVGQDAPCTTRAVLVSVINNTLQTLTNLKINNFSAEAQDGKIEVISAQPNTPPGRVLLLIDNSGSMRGNKLAVAQRLALALASTADARTEVSAYSFADNHVDFLGSQKDLQALRKSLQLLRAPKGRTAMRDAVLRVLAGVQNPGPEDTVYLLTDGLDNVSRASPGELTKALLKSGVRLSAAVFYDEREYGSEEQGRRGELEGMVRAAGGFYTVTVAFDLREPDKDTIRRIDLLARLSNHQYKLVLKTTSTSNRSLRWKLRLTNLPPEMKKFRPLYPSELPACTATN